MEFVARFQDVIFAGKPVVVLRDVACFLGLATGLKKAKSNISQTMWRREAHEVISNFFISGRNSHGVTIRMKPV